MKSWLAQRKNKSLQVKAVRNEKEGGKTRFVWYRDRKLIGTTLLLLAVAFQIFAFLEVPFFSTIHSYTIGMLFGYYNPFFYFFVAFVALRMVLGPRFNLPPWVRITGLTYWLFVIFFIFLVSSLSYYQVRTDGWTKIGAATWDATSVWFEDFRAGPWYAPANTNGGVVGAILYAFFAMCLSGIGALVVALLSILGIAGFVGYRTYKSFLKRRGKGNKNLKTITTTVEQAKPGVVEPVAPPIEMTNSETDEAAQESTLTSRKSPLKPALDISDLPFEDPFATNK